MRKQTPQTEFIDNSNMHVFISLKVLWGAFLFVFLEQEFAKNVIKTAEGAKTNVGHQVNLCFLEHYRGGFNGITI